jgi:hypothetical protein
MRPIRLADQRWHWLVDIPAEHDQEGMERWVTERVPRAGWHGDWGYVLFEDRDDAVLFAMVWG